ncbi:MAG TPA: GNAT family N-acetyltransferase [Candidatus Udaeobacter sp.]|nr:GNAT family N-acetyltransferase [Candidatus Udaeobacter sp.]
MDLKPATLGDAAMVADLETARTPDDPQDGEMVAYRWTHEPESKVAMRLVAWRDDTVWAFVEATHGEWNQDVRRFGWVNTAIHPDDWTERLYRRGIATGEEWLRSETSQTAVAIVRADLAGELGVLQELGYREERRERYWELDLIGRRTELLAGAKRSRAQMDRQGIRLMTVDQDKDPQTIRKLHELDVQTTNDIPTTVPFTEPTLDEWVAFYFENPGIHKDRFWIARLDDEVVGMSLIVFPPGREPPLTEYTATSPGFRGRGIARALKYETIAQAIALGFARIRTDNDSENAPILHINAEMGYQPLTPYIELHRDL